MHKKMSHPADEIQNIIIYYVIWASIYNEGELRQQKPSFAPMYCARMDVKPTNRRRRSVDSAIALRFKAGRDFTWTR